VILVFVYLLVFYVDAPSTAEIYALSLHDALPIYEVLGGSSSEGREAEINRHASVVTERIRHKRSDAKLGFGAAVEVALTLPNPRDRKSTRLNSSHEWISYAVFCLKKTKNTQTRSH